MIFTYFKFSVRNILRNKMFGAINIAGLAISLTAFILMALYIENELSFDKFNANAENIYRVTDDKQTPDIILRSAATAAPVAPAMKQEFPQIKEAVRVINTEAVIKYGNRIFEERKLFFADYNIFNVFSFKILQGNANNALVAPASIVLTKMMSEKYFGVDNPIGKSLSVDGKTMMVNGVIENVPENSHLNFDFLISMSTAQQKGSGYDWLFTNWYSNNFYTYILLPQNYTVKSLANSLEAFDTRHKEPGNTTKHHYGLEKLTDIYLRSDRDNQVGETGSLSNLYIFSVTALFILLIACINFINLSTSRGTTRAKEVAVKKVAGALKSQMIAQFLTESFLITACSLALAIMLAFALMPWFNILTGKLLKIDILSSMHISVLLTTLFVVGILSGSYPAFILSGFSPAAALKDKIAISSWNIRIKKSLVIFQFSISVILIVCSIVVYHQMQFLQNHDLGFKPSQTMVINFEGDRDVLQKLPAIKSELLKVAGIEDITASSNVPGDRRSGSWSMDFAKKGGDTIRTELPVYSIDFHFFEQYKIPVIGGRTFSTQYADDSIKSMIINETALKNLGFASAEDAIGVNVGMYPSDAKIIGVCKDFHFESLQKVVAPLAVRVIPFKYRLLSIEMNTTNIKKTTGAIEAMWKNLVPGRPLEYSFLDVNFNKQYQSEINFGQVFALFTILAIVIACVGLYGLALFSVQQRTKEIGIRKILGASVVGITTTLSKDFILLVAIAILIASPVSWYVMHRWLQDFAYRVNIGWWVFVLAGVQAILVALVTVSFEAIKAAVANPVKCLRNQ